MIVDITQDVMQYYCPFTRDVKGSKIFDNYAESLRDADRKLLVKMLGQQVYSHLQTGIENGNYAQVEEAVKRYLCNEAAWRSAGKHDLIQTPHGFGTVSGQQEIVASAARVNAMKVECRKEAVKAWDDIIDFVDEAAFSDEEKDSATSLWSKLMISSQWKSMTDHIVYNNAMMDKLVETLQDDSLEEADKLEKYAWHIGSVESKIRLLIGRDTLSTLLKHIREHTAVDKENDALYVMQQWVGVSIRKEGNPFAAVDALKRELLNMIDKNITVFPEFAESITYKGMHTAPFESKETDHSYWF